MTEIAAKSQEENAVKGKMQVEPEKPAALDDVPLAGLELAFNRVVQGIDYFCPGSVIQRIVKSEQRSASVELYTVLKTILPLALLYFGAYNWKWICILTIWLTIETINYCCFHIFQAKKFTAHNSSMSRNILLGIFNYMEMVFNFALLYGAFGGVRSTASFDANRTLGFLDYIYFSVVTGATVGYGDLVATGGLGHFIVICQIFIFILFIGIFITYNLSLFINKNGK